MDSLRSRIKGLLGPIIIHSRHPSVFLDPDNADAYSSTTSIKDSYGPAPENVPLSSFDSPCPRRPSKPSALSEFCMPATVTGTIIQNDLSVKSTSAKQQRKVPLFSLRRSHSASEHSATVKADHKPTQATAPGPRRSKSSVYRPLTRETTTLPKRSKTTLWTENRLAAAADRHGQRGDRQVPLTHQQLATHGHDPEMRRRASTFSVRGRVDKAKSLQLPRSSSAPGSRTPSLAQLAKSLDCEEGDKSSPYLDASIALRSLNQTLSSRAKEKSAASSTSLISLSLFRAKPDKARADAATRARQRSNRFGHWRPKTPVLQSRKTAHTVRSFQYTEVDPYLSRVKQLLDAYRAPSRRQRQPRYEQLLGWKRLDAVREREL
ncbi:hypothetical protein BZA70DRAFT_294626 [Myxozyma melibiosi]|uniref:Uncharacterized protein n=1 Tax=Myxozyma melibiosi TaxID=54550 RepID=A0ABR1F9B5_9ASCO